MSSRPAGSGGLLTAYERGTSGLVLPLCFSVDIDVRYVAGRRGGHRVEPHADGTGSVGPAARSGPPGTVRGDHMAGKRVTQSVRLAVLTEAGYRCGVPACRGIIALDIHHLVPVREDGQNEPGNLLALCPNCHALYERGTIAAEAIETYKGILVALMAAFDRTAIDHLMFLAQERQDRRLVLSGDGVAPFPALWP
jgi:HNH endonuclease